MSFTDDGRLIVSIRDDGLGFEPPKLPYDLIRQGHFGLAGSMSESRWWGHLSVDSAPGRRTRLVALMSYHGPS